MKASARICILILLPVLSFYSCTKPDITFGADYLDNNYTNIVIVDTATPVIFTVYLDSFVTSGSGRAVVGKYKDPYFGSVTAESYFPIAPPAWSDIYSNTTFDSLELILKPNKSFYGDTSQQLQINVRQLQSQIAFAENKTALYNVTSFPAGQTLGTKTLLVRPSVTDSISIRLSNTLGADLLSKLQGQSDIVQTPAKFYEYFNGINISAGTNAFMLGFSDSIIMRLHYNKEGLIRESKWVDFTLADKTLQFNNIFVDRASTAISSLSSSNNELLASATNSAGYLQSSTGTLVKISFPYLRDFLAIKNYIKILKAELVVKPVSGTYSGLYALPPQLRLSETTQLNQLGNDITIASSGSYTTQYGGLVVDDLYGENTSYTYDITSYINSQIGIATANRNGLIISPPAPPFQSDFNRILIADKISQKGGIRLRLYYVTVSL